uniref:Reverse transcriptase domain-containing protein n=1 Tax=Macrostomum lignano TaxID=282301 RepID=A0A1I8IJE6_9PLAT
MNRVLFGEEAPNEWTTAHSSQFLRSRAPQGLWSIEAFSPALRSCSTGCCYRDCSPCWIRTCVLSRTASGPAPSRHGDADSGSLVLRAYNVPEQLSSAIMTMYRDTTAAVSTLDGLSDFFETSSGVLQGDTLAPFLFVLVLVWVPRTALSTNDDGFLLRRRVGRRQLERRLSVLGYAHDLALLSSTLEGAQRQLDKLVFVAASVGLVVNTQKTVVLCVPDDIETAILCRCADGYATEFLRCHQFAVIETVLLYNAETWTLTDSLEQQVDAAHAGLLRAAFKIGYERVTDVDLYHRAGLVRPSDLLRCRLQLAGHIIRAETYAHRRCRRCSLSRQAAGGLGRPRSRPTPRRKRQIPPASLRSHCLLADAGAPDSAGGVAFVRDLALRRALSPMLVTPMVRLDGGAGGSGINDVLERESDGLELGLVGIAPSGSCRVPSADDGAVFFVEEDPGRSPPDVELPVADLPERIVGRAAVCFFVGHQGPTAGFEADRTDVGFHIDGFHRCRAWQSRDGSEGFSLSAVQVVEAGTGQPWSPGSSSVPDHRFDECSINPEEQGAVPAPFAMGERADDGGSACHLLFDRVGVLIEKEAMVYPHPEELQFFLGGDRVAVQREVKSAVAVGAVPAVEAAFGLGWIKVNAQVICPLFDLLERILSASKKLSDVTARRPECDVVRVAAIFDIRRHVVGPGINVEKEEGRRADSPLRDSLTEPAPFSGGRADSNGNLAALKETVKPFDHTGGKALVHHPGEESGPPDSVKRSGAVYEHGKGVGFVLVGTEFLSIYDQVLVRVGRLFAVAKAFDGVPDLFGVLGFGHFSDKVLPKFMFLFAAALDKLLAFSAPFLGRGGGFTESVAMITQFAQLVIPVRFISDGDLFSRDGQFCRFEHTFGKPADLFLDGTSVEVFTVFLKNGPELRPVGFLPSPVESGCRSKSVPSSADRDQDRFVIRSKFIESGPGVSSGVEYPVVGRGTPVDKATGLRQAVPALIGVAPPGWVVQVKVARDDLAVVAAEPAVDTRMLAVVLAFDTPDRGAINIGDDKSVAGGRVHDDTAPFSGAAVPALDFTIRNALADEKQQATSFDAGVEPSYFAVLANVSLAGLHERRLLYYLFDPANRTNPLEVHNSMERPVKNESNVLYVWFKVSLQQIIDLWQAYTQKVNVNKNANSGMPQTSEEELDLEQNFLNSPIQDEKKQILITNFWLD